MQSFLRSIKAISGSCGCLPVSWLLSGAAIAGLSLLWLAPLAEAAPTRRDWCGTIWSVENRSQLAWINYTTGVVNTTSGPTAEIPSLPQGGIGTEVAALGIHKESGTMYAFDRNGATGTLYKYRFGVDTTWQAVSISGLVGLSGTQANAQPDAGNNLNKMTVDGNTLLIAESTGLVVYSIPLSSAGNVTSSSATVTIYTFTGDPIGTGAHSVFPSGATAGYEIISSGDLVTDEYGDVYNTTYNQVLQSDGSTLTTKAYFYKQVGTTWVYQGQSAINGQFAGAAFYRGNLYAKADQQFLRADLTRSGSGYTGWDNPLINVGPLSATSSADLTACGTPSVSVGKTRQIYTDAALTTLAASQTKVKTGQYIKYTITAQNVGDSWARSTLILDNLPTGTTYMPNSAVLNGTNMGLATYPGSGFTVSSPSISSGIIRYSPDPDTATLSFAVQVAATNGTITNRATTTYIDNENTPSEPADCDSTPKLNCGVDGSPLGLAANVVMVKRITAINGNDTINPNDPTIPLNQVVSNTDPSNDTNANWPSGFLRGAYNAGKIKPGDEIEYTVYFMNANGGTASGVKLCDRIVGSQTFLNDGYGTGKDIQYKLGNNPVRDLTRDVNTAVDRGQLNSSTGTIDGCPAPSISGTNSGTVVIDVTGSGSSNQDDITTFPAATSPGNPTNSYGFFRFKTKVNP